MRASLRQQRALNVRGVVDGGGNAIIEAAKAVTRTTPIVFVTGDDPVRAGTVSSLSRPTGNVTGFAFFNSVLAAKRIELLHEILPSAKIIAFLANPNSADVDEETKAAETAARSLGLDLLILRTASEQDIEINFALLQTRRAQAVVMAADPFLGSQRDRLAVLAIGHAIPLIGTTREYVPAGALISYGTGVTGAYRQAGLYVGRILNGEKPSDLPILQPTKFELAINLKTARVLGIDVSPTLLARADEVIE